MERFKTNLNAGSQKATDKTLSNPKWFPHANQVPYVVTEEKQLYPNDKQEVY